MRKIKFVRLSVIVLHSVSYRKSLSISSILKKKLNNAIFNAQKHAISGKNMQITSTKLVHKMSHLLNTQKTLVV